MKDILGNDLVPGDHIGCAFSYSQASVGTIRLGWIEEIRTTPNGTPEGWIEVKCRWERDPDKVSPWMQYAEKTRWIKI